MKSIKKQWYTMSVGEDGKRHRVWHEYDDNMWAFIKNLEATIFYGDCNKPVGILIGMKTLLYTMPESMKS